MSDLITLLEPKQLHLTQGAYAHLHELSFSENF